MIHKGLTVLAAASVCGLSLLAMPAFAGTLEWSGTVDDTATIRLTGQNVHVNANRKGVIDERERIEGRLPRHFTHVELTDIRGRGIVRLVQEPNERNNFTAVVRIKDAAAGADRYHFTLRWERPGDADRPNGARDRDADLPH